MTCEKKCEIVLLILVIKKRSSCYTRKPGVRKKQQREIQRYLQYLINSVGNINARKLVEVIKAELKIRETKIQALQEMIDSLEDKIKDQNCRLEVLYSKSES